MPSNSGGSGSGGLAGLLTDGRPHQIYNDIRLLERAIRNRWPIKDEDRPLIVERLVGITLAEATTVMTKLGPVEVSYPADKLAVGAAGVLERMERANQSDEHRDDDNARLDAGKKVRGGLSLTVATAVLSNPDAMEAALALQRQVGAIQFPPDGKPAPE